MARPREKVKIPLTAKPDDNNARKEGEEGTNKDRDGPITADKDEREAVDAALQMKACRGALVMSAQAVTVRCSMV